MSSSGLSVSMWVALEILETEKMSEILMGRAERDGIPGTGNSIGKFTGTRKGVD